VKSRSIDFSLNTQLLCPVSVSAV